MSQKSLWEINICTPREYLTSGVGGVLTGEYSTEQENFGTAENGPSLGMYIKSDASDDFVRLLTVTKGGANNNDPIMGPLVISEIMYNVQSPAVSMYIKYLKSKLFDYPKRICGSFCCGKLDGTIIMFSKFDIFSIGFDSCIHAGINPTALTRLR